MGFINRKLFPILAIEMTGISSLSHLQAYWDRQENYVPEEVDLATLEKLSGCSQAKKLVEGWIQKGEEAEIKFRRQREYMKLFVKLEEDLKKKKIELDGVQHEIRNLKAERKLYEDLYKGTLDVVPSKAGEVGTITQMPERSTAFDAGINEKYVPFLKKIIDMYTSTSCKRFWGDRPLIMNAQYDPEGDEGINEVKTKFNNLVSEADGIITNARSIRSTISGEITTLRGRESEYVEKKYGEIAANDYDWEDKNYEDLNTLKTRLQTELREKNQERDGERAKAPNGFKRRVYRLNKEIDRRRRSYYTDLIIKISGEMNEQAPRWKEEAVANNSWTRSATDIDKYKKELEESKALSRKQRLAKLVVLQSKQTKTSAPAAVASDSSKLMQSDTLIIIVENAGASPKKTVPAKPTEERDTSLLVGKGPIVLDTKNGVERSQMDSARGRILTATPVKKVTVVSSSLEVESPSKTKEEIEKENKEKAEKVVLEWLDASWTQDTKGIETMTSAQISTLQTKYKGDSDLILSGAPLGSGESKLTAADVKAMPPFLVKLGIWSRELAEKLQTAKSREEEAARKAKEAEEAAKRAREEEERKAREAEEAARKAKEEEERLKALEADFEKWSLEKEKELKIIIEKLYRAYIEFAIGWTISDRWGNQADRKVFDDYCYWGGIFPYVCNKKNEDHWDRMWRKTLKKERVDILRTTAYYDIKKELIRDEYITKRKEFKYSELRKKIYQPLEEKSLDDIKKRIKEIPQNFKYIVDEEKVKEKFKKLWDIEKRRMSLEHNIRGHLGNAYGKQEKAIKELLRRDETYKV